MGSVVAAPRPVLVPPRLGVSRPAPPYKLVRPLPPVAAPVLPPGVSVVLPNNLIPPGDGDFETGVSGNWAVLANCTIAQSSAQAFTGTHSLAVTAVATGNVQVLVGQSPKFKVAPVSSLVSSFWIWTPNPGRTAQASMFFYTAGSSLISSPSGPVLNATAATWTPVASRYSSPATTALGQMVITITGMTAGETIWIDLVFIAQALWQVVAALATSPLTASPFTASTPYADLTPFLRADQGLGYSGRGRSDEVTQVNAGTGQFTLDNMVIPGAWATGNSGSPFAGWQTGRFVQMNAADENGNWSTRYTGYITDIGVGWQGGPALSSMVPVACQDILGWLGRKNTMRTMVEEEILTDTPVALFTLADPSGAMTASDSSGNAAPPLATRKYGVNGTLTFASGTGIVGSGTQGFSSSPLQSAAAVVSWPSNWAGNVQLEARLPQVLSAAAGFSFEILANMSLTIAAHQITVPISLANSRTGAYVCCGLMTATANIAVGYGTGINTTPSMTTGAAQTIGLGMLFTVTVTGTTASLYLNGNLTVTHAVPAGFTADTIIVNGVPGGGFASGSVNVASGIAGSLNCASVYTGVLTTARMLSHYYTAVFEGQGTQVAQTAGNILRYAGIPAALSSLPYPGVSYLDASEISGQTPLSMLQTYQQADGGVFYVTAAGIITFQDRVARYAAQVTPALVLAAGQYEADLAYTTTTQFQVNDATLSNNNVPGGVRATNTASVNAAGTFSNGDPQSPTSGPLYSFPYTPQPSGQIASTDVLTDAAQYQVNTYGTPAPRSPSLTIDLATQPGGGTNVSRAAVFGVDVGSVIQLTGLPPSGPGGTRAGYLYAEGIAESFTRDDNGAAWTVSFNTSPATQSAAWMPGDPNLGILDSTAVIGRGTDGAKQPGAVRDQVSGIFTSASATTGSITWAVFPAAGSKVLVAVAANTATPPTLVQDNGTSPVTFTLDASDTNAGRGAWIYRGDAITLPASGSYQVTVTFASPVAMSVMGESYTAVAAGAPTASNHGHGTSKTVSTGKVTPTAAGCLFFGAFGDASALNPESIGLTGAGFTTVLLESSGAAGPVTGCADQYPAGPAVAQTLTWSLGDSVAWNAAMAAYPPSVVPSFAAAEYVGPPYPVPSFTAALNRTGSVGANDMRGLAANVALAVSPPEGTAQQVSLAQSIANATDTTIQFDTLWNDTANGFNLTVSATNYTVMLPGVYLLMASVVFASNSTGDRLAWFTQNGSIVTGQTSIDSCNGQPTGVFVTQQVTCAQGDVIQLHGQQTSGGSLALSTTGGGTFFSVLMMGT